MTDTSIAAAIAAAKAAAGQVPAEAGALSGASTAVGAPIQRGAPISMSDLMMDGGITVDHWIKVDKHGFLIGDKKGLITEIPAVELDLSEVKGKYSIKYGSNPPVYKHTYDHQVSTQNESWVLVCQKAAQIDQKAREYRSADLPLVLTSDLVIGKDVVEADALLGLTLSTTAWRPWEAFLKSLVKAGVDIQRDKVTVNIGHETVSRNNNTWGLPTFSLVTN